MMANLPWPMSRRPLRSKRPRRLRWKETVEAETTETAEMGTEVEGAGEVEAEAVTVEAPKIEAKVVVEVHPDPPSVHFIKLAPLHLEVTEEDVRALFEPYGEVDRVDMFWMDLKKEKKAEEDTVKTEIVKTEEATDGETAMTDENADATTTIKEETPATEETKVVVEEEIKPTKEAYCLVGFKAEDARDSAAMFEGELSGKPITAGVFYPRAQRIGLYVSGYPADTKKDDLKEKIEAVTGPCEDFRHRTKFTFVYYPCLKEAMVAREKIKELTLTEDGKALTCDYENTGESAMADVEETVEAETTETAEMGTEVEGAGEVEAEAVTVEAPKIEAKVVVEV
eukprot:583135_1